MLHQLRQPCCFCLHHFKRIIHKHALGLGNTFGWLGMAEKAALLLLCKVQLASNTLSQLLGLSSALDFVKQESPAGLLLQEVHSCGWQHDSRQRLYRSRCCVRHFRASRLHACATATFAQLFKQTQALALRIQVMIRLADKHPNL